MFTVLIYFLLFSICSVQLQVLQVKLLDFWLVSLALRCHTSRYMHLGVSSGTYQFRLFSNSHFSRTTLTLLSATSHSNLSRACRLFHRVRKCNINNVQILYDFHPCYRWHPVRFPQFSILFLSVCFFIESKTCTTKPTSNAEWMQTAHIISKGLWDVGKCTQSNCFRWFHVASV